ncbi:hypothetical protein ACQVP2_16710 [Methylobacterium aquaticum]|uniref:hypothetical protein n=1 Tax=Methylobacterium aquaticum TaxID=270351 RepID=UPI003D18714C
MKEGNTIESVFFNKTAFLIPVQRNSSSFYMHCTGGVRFAQIDDDIWVLEPALIGHKAHRIGHFRRSNLGFIIRKLGLKVIAFQESHWISGSYNPIWCPINTEKINHFRSSSDLWSSIASNISKRRMQNLSVAQIGSDKSIVDILDDANDEERLSRYISLSLRNIDFTVEQICEFYNEQLTDLINRGLLESQRITNLIDQMLFSHVHSFFTHLGNARDYLGAFLAHRLGKNPQKIDAMNKLIDILRNQHFSGEKMLQLMKSKGLFESIEGSTRWREAGWLRDASKIRNEFIHKRPYGSSHEERFGSIIKINDNPIVYRYFRPLKYTNNNIDILDYICHIYRECVTTFYNLAELTGLNTEILAIENRDVISLKIIKE